MESRTLGSLWPVSSLTLGGGGIGQVWGTTNRDEPIATVRAAVDAGINLIDVAPSYGDGEAEAVIGSAFDGRVPEGVRISTKYHVGHGSDEVEAKMRRSLDESLDRLRIHHVDLFILHSQVVPQPDPARQAWTTPLKLFQESARPALQKLVEEGRIGAWGLTAVQFPRVLDTVLTESPTPQAAQMVANLLDSPGDMSWSTEKVELRQLISRASNAGIGVMGIRAVQAGALTDRLDRHLPEDHPASIDYERSGSLRGLAAQLGISTASLAHRYALSMDGVDTVVLGVKDRAELRECLAAADAGPLTPDAITLVDQAVNKT